MACEWRSYEVSDLLSDGKLAVGDGYRAKNSELSRTGLPFARAGNINNGFQFADADHFPTTALARVGNKVSQAGDVVFTSKGTVGRFAFVREDTPRFVYSPQLCFWRSLDRDLIQSRFLYYWMYGSEFYAQFKGVAGQTDMAEYVSLGDQRRMHITLPSIPEQLAIAHILGTLDDKIELNRQMNETLEAMARALFKSWFVHFDPVRAKAEGRDPGLRKLIATFFPASLVDSELGEIPEGWKVGALRTLGELAIGGDWGADEAFAGAVEASCLRGVDLEHLRREGRASAPRRWFTPSSLERRAMEDKDVLVAGSGAGPTGRPLWMCTGLLQALGPCVYSNFCKRIRCDSAAKAVYLDAWLQDMRESGEIWEHVNGTSVPNLDANSLLDGKEVPIPPMPILEEYHDFVRPIWEAKYAGQSDALAALRDTLLPRLMSGELRIRDAGRIIETQGAA
jgi:type I restriction enzyme S subunit